MKKPSRIILIDAHALCYRAFYAVRELRLQCPCALCVDEWTREKKVKGETIAADIRPTSIETVGRYALKIDWSDGHNTGIYPFDSLRKICECPACKKV